jgi:Transposase DDE domain group 1
MRTMERHGHDRRYAASFRPASRCPQETHSRFRRRQPVVGCGRVQLRAAEQKTGIVGRIAAALPDRRDPTRVRHTLFEIIAARVFGISCGYADGIDQNALRIDPALKMAVGRCPETGRDIASRSTVSRFENAPT